MVTRTESQLRTELSLIIPAYNEESGIALAVQEAYEALTNLDYQFEIIVVDDGSSDQTATKVLELAITYPTVRLIQHPVNRGYGAALATGFRSAQYSLVAFTDADSQFFLEDLRSLVPLTKSVPVVVGRRVDRKDPWRRRFFSWGYNRLVRFLLGTGVQDCDCALKVFRREVLPYLMPKTAGFFVNTEMLVRARRIALGIAEVPVRHRPRATGNSKVSLWEIPKTIRKVLQFWWHLPTPTAIDTIAGFQQPTFQIPAVYDPYIAPTKPNESSSRR